MPPLEPIPQTPIRERSNIPTPDTIQRLDNELNQIQNQIIKESYLDMANKLIDRKVEDNKIDKALKQTEAQYNPNGPEAMKFKKDAFNLLKQNNRAINDEVETNFQNALNLFNGPGDY